MSCILWEGAKKPSGYGNLWADGRYWSAHRYAWTKAHGPIPKGKWVLHTCDNPSCINVAHLYLGTALDNSRDAVDRGRLDRSAETRALQAERTRAAWREGRRRGAAR